MNHITCFLHLLHNCVFKIRTNFQKVDKLIATMKLMVHKNYTKKKLFKKHGGIPETIITRWGTWLNAGVFSAENLNGIKKQ